MVLKNHSSRNLLKFFVAVCLFSVAFLASGQTASVSVKYPTSGTVSNTAVIVCPGGSYYWLDKDGESVLVSQWLASNGITAFVLEYPTSGWASFFFHIRRPDHNQYPSQLDALKWALKLAKNQGFENIGVMGFSAGGHLALNAAIDTHDTIAPDFVTAIYPVVSLNEPYAHSRSRRGLLGERRRNSLAMRDSLSIELHANRIDCPVFLMNCIDDPVVDYHNSVILNESMERNGKSNLITYIQYAEGGHGFGADPLKTVGETIKWKERWLDWLKTATDFKTLDNE